MSHVAVSLFESPEYTADADAKVRCVCWKDSFRPLRRKPGFTKDHL